MWIRNKVTGTLQEIHNADVIKVCKKEPDKYELSEEYPGDNEKIKAAAQAAAGGEGAGNNAGTVNYEEMKLNDLRKIAKEKGIQGYNNMDKATLIAVIQAH